MRWFCLGSGQVDKKPKATGGSIGTAIPDIAAHQFPSEYRRQCQVADYLHRCFKNATPISVDFDLAVAYFLQQTNHLKLGNIPGSINLVLKDFSILPPLTGRQKCLFDCARYIKTTLDEHDKNPELPKPFALRYPNLEELNNLAIERSSSPIVVGKDEAIILLDLANRVLAVSVPPKRSITASTPSGQVCLPRPISTSQHTLSHLGTYHSPCTYVLGSSPFGSHKGRHCT